MMMLHYEKGTFLKLTVGLYILYPDLHGITRLGATISYVARDPDPDNCTITHLIGKEKWIHVNRSNIPRNNQQPSNKRTTTSSCR